MRRLLLIGFALLLLGLPAAYGWLSRGFQRGMVAVAS